MVSAAAVAEPLLDELLPSSAGPEEPQRSAQPSASSSPSPTEDRRRGPTTRGGEALLPTNRLGA